MRRLLASRLRLIVLVLLCSTSALYSQDLHPRPLDAPKAFKSGQTADTHFKVPRLPAVFPLFIEDENFSSTLTLINSSTLQTYATLLVRDPAGHSSESTRINLGPHAQVRIKVKDLLDSMGLFLRSGSILVKQSPGLRSPSILGQLTLVSPASGSPSYVEEEMAMPGILDSQELRSVSEEVEESPRVAVTSISTEVQHITIQCFLSGNLITNKATLTPGGMALLRPCETGPASASTDSKGAAPVGISIFSDGPNGGFAAFGISSHRKPENGAEYLGALQFVDPQSMNSSSLVFTGVSSGQSLTPVPGEYTSYLSLANFGSAEANIRVTTYRTSSTGTVSNSSQDVLVGPQSATQVALGSLSTTNGEVVSVVADSDAAAGEVFGKIISVGSSPPYQIEQLTKDATDQRNGGDHPWNITDDSTSDLVLFNHTSRPQRFDIAIDAGVEFDWTKQVTLTPFETRTISIGRIVLDKISDDHKRTLPANAKSGTVMWQAAAPGIGSGRVLIRSPLNFAAQSFSCGQAYVLCDGFVLLDSPINAGGFGSASAIARFCIDYTGGTQCFGDPGFDGGADYTSWQSSNTNVATVGGAVGSANAATTAVSPGSCVITAAMLTDFCEVDASAGLDVIPRLDSISPPRGLIGSSVPVTLNGEFGNSSVSINAGTGITVTVNSYSSSQINATFAISSSATTGNHQVTVSANGATSAAIGFFVQVPTSSRIVQTLDSHALSSTSTPACPSGKAGWYRVVKKLVTDQAGSDIVQDPQSLTEVVTLGTPNDLQIGSTGTSGSATTNGGGYFEDTLSVCTSVCPGNTGETDETQVITDLPPGTTTNYQLSPNSFVYKCTGITINGQ